MQWNPGFSIGVDKIDDQHKRLFQLADQLEQALTGQQASETMGRALKFLVDYTSYHFKDEESLMFQITFAEYEAHRALHKQLIESVRNILLDIRKGHLPPVAELIRFLNHWIVEHIEHEDKKIGAAIQAIQNGFDRPDQKIDMIKQSTTHELKNNLAKIASLVEQQLITDADLEVHKKELLDKFIRKFKPASTVEVIEEFNSLQALHADGLITEADQERILPRFSEKIDLAVLLAGDHSIEASLAHLNALVEKKLITEAVREPFKRRLLKQIR